MDDEPEFVLIVVDCFEDCVEPLLIVVGSPEDSCTFPTVEVAAMPTACVDATDPGDMLDFPGDTPVTLETAPVTLVEVIGVGVVVVVVVVVDVDVVEETSSQAGPVYGYGHTHLYDPGMFVQLPPL